MTRPVYFTLSSKSIQKFEQQLQTNIISVQIAFYLLDRGEEQGLSRRIEALLTTLEAAVGIMACNTKLQQADTLEGIQLSAAELKDLDDRIEAATNTTANSGTDSPSFQAHVMNEGEAPNSAIHLLTAEETLAWGSVNRQLFGSTIANQTTQAGSSVLIEAITRHSPGRFQQLLEDGVNINGADDQGHTPLMHTVFQHGKHCKECRRCMHTLLQLNVETDMDNQGVTALHLAVMHNHLDAAKLLLEKGADIDASSPNTPLMMAVKKGQAVFVELFLTFRPNLNIADTAKWSLIHHAVWRDRRESLCILLEQNKNMDLGLDLDARCEMDWTPLMHLAQYAHRPAKVHLAKLLLDHGANVDATDISGYSALYYAITHGPASPQRDEFVKLLLGRATDAQTVRLKVSSRVINRFPAFR